MVSATLYITLILLTCMNAFAHGGPLAYAACQTACNYGAVTCYAVAGLTFGTVSVAAGAAGPVGWIAWLSSAPASTIAAASACGLAQGACMAACTPLLVTPTP